MSTTELQISDWRRQVAQLYAAVRAEPNPEQGHALWRAGRDRLFRTHPQSPLAADDPLRRTGLPYWPYDPDLRFELPVLPMPPVDGATEIAVPTDGDGTTRMRPIGRVELPAPLQASLTVWSLLQYAGGLFVPLRDGTAGSETYGGGRYALDTAKGADLGGEGTTLVLDLNFLYHPSCRYNARWQCPLAPQDNTVPGVPVRAGERL
jgi:hypothetical protein